MKCNFCLFKKNYAIININPVIAIVHSEIYSINKVTGRKEQIYIGESKEETSRWKYSNDLTRNTRFNQELRLGIDSFKNN